MFMCITLLLRRRRRFAGAEHCSRETLNESQVIRNPHNVRMRAAKHAPPELIRLRERPHCLTEIVERGAGVPVERPTTSR